MNASEQQFINVILTMLNRSNVTRIRPKTSDQTKSTATHPSLDITSSKNLHTSSRDIPTQTTIALSKHRIENKLSLSLFKNTLIQARVNPVQ